MNDQPENKNTPNQFLNPEGGKTKTNAIEVPSISLPKGGGAIKGIDEKFSVNAVNGSASFSIPLPFAPARGVAPSFSLSYNSGNGNGIFGLGWNLAIPSIKRKTDKGLPQYLDPIDSDTFLFSEAEDLVPEFKKGQDGDFLLNADGGYIINEKNSPDNLCTIRYYKPRVEGLFACIERWMEKTTGMIKWRMISKENVTTLFGWGNNSVIADPNDHKKIFEWLPEFVFDDKGNCCHYVYKKENADGFDNSLLHNKNRFKNGDITYTNLYLEKVIYGNKTPYIAFGDTYPAETDYMFQTVFDYGEYSHDAPFSKTKKWDFRADAFSDYKPGFELRTTRLCKRVLLFHYFNELPGGSALVKSTHVEYDTISGQGFTFLKKATLHGYIKKTDGTYTSKKLPSIEFEYQKPEWDKEVKTISPGALVHAPSGIEGQSYQFTDLFNEGLSGILTEQTNGWYYKHNLGNGNFSEAKLVTPKPSFAGLGGLMQLADLDADGGKQLVNYQAEPKGFFELSDDNEWLPFKNFKQLPNINLSGPNVRMLDLNGDGKADALITEENVFAWYGAEGRKGFSDVNKTPKPFDEEAGPAIVFADNKQGVYLADMSGDGMNDIVRIRNGEVCYWPNLGYGKFGAKVSMGNAPVFDHPGAFNTALVHLADIDGSGTTDIIYLGKNKFSCWMNLNGNDFSPTPFEIEPAFEINGQVKVSVTDLLGNGVSCIVWSSALSKDAHSPLKYIDLMNGKKPHLMVFYKNNLGKEVSLEYTPSTKYYVEDKLAGTPWITKLHFPVHCISKTETRDMVTGYRFTSSYQYHHGYYDHAEREFRGFGKVVQTDTEHVGHWVKSGVNQMEDRELHQDPVVTKSWFHTGAFLSKEKILAQFASEYWYEEMTRKGFSVTSNEHSLPDALLIAAPGLSPDILEQLSAEEWQQALRACKSMVLRTETFAKDAPETGATSDQIKKELTPYSVGTHNCTIELLQPKGQNRHAIFLVKESEAITYSYERDTTDPRVAHNINIKLDEYGNVLESASIVYPRMLADTTLPIEIQKAQNQTTIIYTQNQFTNDVVNDDEYRLRLPSEVKMYELKGVAKSSVYYTIQELENILSTSVNAQSHETDKEPVPGTSQKRLIEHIRSTYYNNGLSVALPLHQLHSKAIPYENYQLAYTPELVNDIFGAKVTPALMMEGKFTNSEGDSNWWVRSGTKQYLKNIETLADAQSRFYAPIAFTDPYGAITKVKYYGNYFLFVEETEDALGNRSKVGLFNFHALSPQLMVDANNNLSESITDELGMLKASAVFGKGTEADDLTGLDDFTSDEEKTWVADFFNSPSSATLTSNGKNLLKHATKRFLYDFEAYQNSGKPVALACIAREGHFQENNNSPVQLSFEYSNGLGQVIMKKVQAEPGIAKKVTVNPDDSFSVLEVDTAALNPKQLRWIGNGRLIQNNKGNVVKQYEPYFSVTHQYEDTKELVESGVTSIMYYDAVGRLTKTEFPNGTLSRIEFNSWKQSVYDPNDTIFESSWYHGRTNQLIDAKLIAEGKNPVYEKEAADKAFKHANTPNTQHFNTLGRPVLSIEHNKNIITNADEFYLTSNHLDAEGNLRSSTDARGNIVVQYKYDMLGNKVYQHAMDSGKRWLLANILGSHFRTWDKRNHEFQFYYDILHRPLYNKIVGGDGPSPLDNIYDRTMYGESLLFPDRSNEAELQAKNLIGKTIKHYDTAGLIDTPAYDFKGQPISVTRKLFKNYKAVANWIDENLLNDLEDEQYTFTTETDAIGRITKQIAPDGSIILPSYNETGLLAGETITHADTANTVAYIKNINYNEKGLRDKIIYGNDVFTKYYYDKETFRLIRLETKKQNNGTLQDLHYTFDPAGNITHVEDKNIPQTFFNNNVTQGISTFTYDALYRLVESTGRENNAALGFNGKDNWGDAPFMHQITPGDPMAVNNYTESYQYDTVGNILQMKHQAPGNHWARNYTYQLTNNHLINTQVGGTTYIYPHHPHGFITSMPHLEELGWNFKEELVKSIRQKRTDGGTPETTYYQYDGQGQRIRKITENTASAGNTPTKKEERIYIAGYELYKKHSGTNTGLQRKSLSLIEKGNCFLMVETRNHIDDGTEKQLVRYQLHNHIGSASLELDEHAEVISYEEYHPFGTTAYQLINADIKSAAKRYRFTGKERDEETGLYYHGARYLTPWLGRWISSDPIGLKGGINFYAYSNNNPLRYNDPSGTQAKPPDPQTSGAIPPYQFSLGLQPGWWKDTKSAEEKSSEFKLKAGLKELTTPFRGEGFSDIFSLTYRMIRLNAIHTDEAMKPQPWARPPREGGAGPTPLSFELRSPNKDLGPFIAAMVKDSGMDAQLIISAIAYIVPIAMAADQLKPEALPGVFNTVSLRPGPLDIGIDKFPTAAVSGSFWGAQLRLGISGALLANGEVTFTADKTVSEKEPTYKNASEDIVKTNMKPGVDPSSWQLPEESKKYVPNILGSLSVFGVFGLATPAQSSSSIPAAPTSLVDSYGAWSIPQATIPFYNAPDEEPGVQLQPQGPAYKTGPAFYLGGALKGSF